MGYGPRRIVFMHGWLSDHRVYSPIMPLLDETQVTAAFPDYRGYGRSRGLVGDYSAEEIARDALELMDALGWERAHLVGHSMGGMAIQKLGCLAPERMISGTAITPVPASGFPLDGATAAFFRSAVTEDAALAEIFDILTGKRHLSAFREYMIAEARAATTAPALEGYLATWTGTDFAADVAGLQSPFLVIAGAHDGALGPDVMRKSYLTQLPRVNMEIIEAAGHYPMHETPIELMTLISRFHETRPS
jgi:pimeloyl-ACP methyl ester carboxylesterase